MQISALAARGCTSDALRLAAEIGEHAEEAGILNASTTSSRQA